MISTIAWSNQKVERTHQIFSLGFILFGILLMTSAFTVFPKESSWGSIYSILGIVILILGILRELKIKTKIGKVSVFLGLFLATFSACLFGDYLSVTRQSPPLYRYMTTIKSPVIEYKTFLYNVYRIHPNTSEEYYLIDHKKEYTIDTVPISPLNMNKSDIENLMQYQNKYVGNNSNDGALLSKLPLSEYGYVFQIDSQNLGLKVNYRIMDWYIRDSRNALYLEQSLLYNSAAIFLLIENVNCLSFNFSGVIYKVTREDMERTFPHYRELKKENAIQTKLFRKYVGEMLADPDFIYQYFDQLLKKDINH